MARPNTAARRPVAGVSPLAALEPVADAAAADPLAPPVAKPLWMLAEVFLADPDVAPPDADIVDAADPDLAMLDDEELYLSCVVRLWTHISTS